MKSIKDLLRNMDPKVFEEKKDEVIENIDVLMTRLDVCVNSGMLDSEAQVHNEIFDLRDDTDEVETPDELAQIIYKCRTIETNIDRWLSSRGETTVGLSWPQIEEGTMG